MKTKQFIVPLRWYNEEVNELARTAMHYLRTFGRDSDMFKMANDKRLAFKAKYKPSKDIKLGCLEGAKQCVLVNKDKIKNSRSIKSKYDACNFVGYLMDKYYLSNKQTYLLMNFMSKHDLLY